MHWLREAANIGSINACPTLAFKMYLDQPYAREVGLLGEAAGRGLHSSTSQLSLSHV
jgi:hypothetical protein